MIILAIDPGPIESAYVLLNDDLKPCKFGKVPNEHLLELIYKRMVNFPDTHFVIEMVAHYGTGMPAGKDVFDTCVWIGRFWQIAEEHDECKRTRIYRKDEKMNLCGHMQAKDGNIRRALIDRFARHDFKNGKGTKAKPDWFYGFRDDIWQAYAVGVTYADLFLDPLKVELGV